MRGADVEESVHRAWVRSIEDAMWAGDVDRLNRLAPCECCCHEHTFGPGCPAWVWGGCRGYGTMTRDEYESWRNHYQKYHDIDLNDF